MALVRCLTCNSGNPADAKYCCSCGSPLQIVCARCGASNPPDARFCPECGIARAEGLNRAYISRFLCLAFLAPEITKAILEGRQPTELTAKRLIRLALMIPLLWPDQHASLLDIKA